MQRRVPSLPTALVGALILGYSATSWSQSASYAQPAASTLRAPAGQGLARSAGAAGHGAAVAAALRGAGADAATAGSLVQVGGGLARTGLTHVRLEQQVGGLTVYGSSVKATFDARGELVQVAQRIAPVGAGAPRGAAIGERQALAAAMAAVHPDVRAAFIAGGRSGHSQRYAGGTFFHQDPEVTRVLVPQDDGSLAEGFLVETWTQKGNLLDHTLVGGDGTVLAVERRTANDSYNVFTVDPGKTPQTLKTGPLTGGTLSPSGWLGSGAQTTININGNNASAYIDADANNAPDTGGAAVTNGSFTTAAVLTAAPNTTGNKAVAVQNLFYLNNVIHDILYSHGFDEIAGNFQVSNFGKGGAQNDPVNAEAQDGGGTDNANFSTPTDGTRPRMQMYLWTGSGPTHEVVVSGSPYGAAGAEFGPTLTTTGIGGAIAAALDGGVVSTDGCETITSAVSGKIALLDRGLCDFVIKVKNAQNAGATGVIVANNAPGAPFTMGGTTRLRIPSVMVSQADGATLRGLIGSVATLRKKSTAPLQLDGDLDSDIVYHEYGHGLTWRMIGSMSGPLAGAIGEGASDVVAFMVNDDDIVGEYAYGDPAGIRRYRYAGYPLTYKDVTGAEVHNDGEIYAAAMWRLRELWLASGRSNDALFDVFVTGMNYTQASPAFEHMRNGMLQSIQTTGGADAAARCKLVWDAFAQYGIGVGASGTVSRRGVVTIVPSTQSRSDCSH